MFTLHNLGMARQITVLWDSLVRRSLTSHLPGWKQGTRLLLGV